MLDHAQVVALAKSVPNSEWKLLAQAATSLPSFTTESVLALHQWQTLKRPIKYFRDNAVKEAKLAVISVDGVKHTLLWQRVKAETESMGVHDDFVFFRDGVVIATFCSCTMG